MRRFICVWGFFFFFLCGCATIKVSDIQKRQMIGVYTSSYQLVVSGYGDLGQGEGIRSLARDLIFSNFNGLKMIDLNPDLPQIEISKNVPAAYGLNSSVISFDFSKLKEAARGKGCSSVFYAHAQFVGDLSNNNGLNKDVWGSIQMGLYDIERALVVTEVNVDMTYRDYLVKVGAEKRNENYYSFYKFLLLKGIQFDK